MTRYLLFLCIISFLGSYGYFTTEQLYAEQAKNEQLLKFKQKVIAAFCIYPSNEKVQTTEGAGVIVSRIINRDAVQYRVQYADGHFSMHTYKDIKKHE